MTKQGGWPPSGFGDRLRRLREKAGLTQRQLAEHAGCNAFTVAKLERGAQEPAWPLVLALARALNVSCEAFTQPVDGPAPEPKRGRPPKALADPPAEPEPKRPRGRPRKDRPGASTS
jgi:transcriptional regulator with XRE-family HTH domain